MNRAGMTIVRVADLPWEDRVNVDGWPSRIGLYYQNPEHRLMVRLVDFPAGAVEPRHVHPGRHGTTLLKGKVHVDGLALEPLDVILGPSNEPHGPLEYPERCHLVSCFQGDDFHQEAESLSAEKNYRLIQQAEIPWQPLAAGGGEVKTLVDHGLETMLIEAYRFPSGAAITPTFLAAVVLDGAPRIGDDTLGTWDFFHRNGDANPGVVAFPDGGTLLAVTMRSSGA